MFSGREITDRTSQLDALDGLRGLAVLLVFLSHTSLRGDHLIPGVDFSGIGKSGVFFFFILSAFLLTRPFPSTGKDALTAGYISWYAMRRFLRIFPLYLVYLSGALVMTHVLDAGEETRVHAWPWPLDLNGYLAHLLLQEGRGITWSIPVEFRYYFVLPFVSTGFAILLKNRLLWCALATAGLVLLSEILWPQAESLVNDIRMRPYLPIFFLGSFLAVVYHQLSMESSRVRIIIETFGWIAVILLIASIPRLTAWLTGMDIRSDFFHRQFLGYGLLWSLVLLAAVRGRGWLKWFFELPALRYLGFVSFSFYLFHVPVIDLVYQIDMPGVLYPWVMLLLTGLASHLSWVLLEKPLSRIRPAFFRRTVAA